MKIKQLLGASTLLILFVLGCKTQKKFDFVSPKDGATVVFGQTIPVKLNFPDTSFDSVVYAVDGQVIERKNDTSTFNLDSKSYALGNRSLTAKLYANGKENIAYSNIVILPEAATQYSFELVNEFPHDTSAFTQGLEFSNGFLYETTGQKGESTLRKVEVNTGKVVQKADLGDEYFGEGMTIIGDKIIVLTWRENVGFVFNKATFAKEQTFEYQNSKEGWGICYDGTRLIKSDGSNKLYFLDPITFKETGSIAVFDENGEVDSINELEFIDGKVYANIYQKDVLVIINPENGAVEGNINLVGLYKNPKRLAHENELNGIAYDHKDKRFFVTGKRWNKLFEIKVVKR
ncbi:glutaminyl-peptide cyclotransferase [Sphingobacterium hungaricum]